MNCGVNHFGNQAAIGHAHDAEEPDA